MSAATLFRSTATAPQETPPVVRGSYSDELLSNLTPAAGLFYDVSVPEPALSQALSVALASYPIFSGRLRGKLGELEFVCDGQGILFTTARVPWTMREGIAKVQGGDLRWVVEPLDAGRCRSGKEPLLNLRVTYFSDGGMVLGCCWHHSVGDNHTFMSFLKAWSAAAAGEKVEPPIIVPDRDAYLRDRLPRGSEQPGIRVLGLGEIARLGVLALTARQRCRAVWFNFADEELVRMRDAVAAKAGRRLSRNDVVCAHLFDLVREADPATGERVLSVGVNYRSHAAIPAAVLGNLAMALATPFAPDEDAATVAARVRDRLDHYAEKHLDHHATQRYYASLSALDKKRCLWVGIDPLRRALFVTSAANAGGYDVTFGVKRPVYISPLPFVPFPWMTVLLEGTNGRGLMFGGYFPTEVANRLRALGPDRIHAFRDPGDPVADEDGLLSAAL